VRRLAIAVLFFGALVLAWHLIAASGRWPPTLVPPPLGVARYLADSARDGSLLDATLVTARRLFIGYGIGLLIGFPLGCLSSRFKSCQDTIGLVALGLQTLPSVCWAPLAVLWFGQTEAAMVFVVVMGTVWSIQIATDAGLRCIPPIYLRAARVMGSRGLHTIGRVLVPASLPVVAGGMKQGWAFAWRSLMAAEIYVTILTGFGLGRLLHESREVLAMDGVVAVMLVIVLVGLAVDRLLFAPAERWIHRRWGTGG
jgi:NitT/TauT family transport system permease protein